MKSSNLRHSLACSQNKGLSEYQRRVSQLRTCPSPHQRQSQKARGDSQSQKVRGNLGPRDGILHQTVSRLPVANQVFLGSWTIDICQEDRSQRSAPRGDTRHTWGGALAVHPGNWVSGMGEVIKTQPTWRERTRQAPEHLSFSNLGRAQNTGPTKSVPLWSTREPEPERLRPGKCTKPRACFGQFPCRATWSLSSVDGESTHAVSGGRPSVAETLWTLPTHTSDICLKCPSLPTAQLDKWA